MQKEKGIVSIKVKLLGVIVPVVIVSILVLELPPEQCRFIKRNSKSPGSFNDTGAFFEKGTTPLVLSVQQF